MAAATAVQETLTGLELPETDFVDLLEKLIGEAKFVQNAPPDLVPEEDRVAAHVLAALAPYTTANGGPLTVEHITYVAGRGNVKVSYPGTTDRTVSFVGSHMDVVPANPEEWTVDPFHMTRKGDRLYGRGTTDCLGHVALLTEFFIALAKARPALETTVIGIFIACEEAAAVPRPGVETLMEHGVLAPCFNGPTFWVDCSDSQPCMGTAGSMTWHLNAKGKLFHSGLPHKGINSIELADEAVKYLQQKFYTTFHGLPEEVEYMYATPSTMKPTQVTCTKNGLNQICGSCTISGDIRLTPFWKIEDVRAAVTSWVEELNADLSVLAVRGPVSKFELPPVEEGKAGERGVLTLTWGEGAMEGIACDRKSRGFQAMCSAVEAIKGSVKPYSICGSLPLVAELKRAGLDLQLIGFGLMSTYHAVDEYCLLSDMKDAFKVLSRVVSGCQ